MLTNIDKLQKLISENNIFTVILIVICILLIVQEAITKFDWIFERFGIETKKSLEQKKQSELLSDISVSVNKLYVEIEEQKELAKDRDGKYTTAIEEVKEKLNQHVNQSVLDRMKELRWKIIDFASAISNGKICTQEQFNQIYRFHKEYMELIELTDEENGYEEDSFDVIREEYKRRLNDGEFKKTGGIYYE